MATKDQSSRMPISLKEINRKPQDALPDGALLDLINMRFTNNALRPVANKVRLNTSSDPHPQFKVLYKHIISESVYAFWGTSAPYLVYQVYVKESGSGNYAPQTATPVLGQIVTGDLTFSSLGNACMISDLVLEQTFVMLFQPDTNNYRVFDKLLPDMPLVTLDRVAASADNEETPISLDITSSDDAVDIVIKGIGQEMWAKKVAKGYLIGKYLVRCAWELFDGTIIMHTIPAYIEISEIEEKWRYSEGAPGHIPVTKKFTGYQLRYKLNIESADLVILKAKYKGIVKSFNIYLTNHGSLVELHKVTMTEDVYYSMTIPAGYTSILTNNWIANEIFYFELVKIGLDSLVADTSTSVKLTDTSTLSSGNVMTAGNLSVHSIFGKSLFSYNQRVFFGNIKNTLFKGTNLRGFIAPGGDDNAVTPYNIGISYDLDTPDGTRRVFTGWFEYNYWSIGTGEIMFNLTGLLGYPDARCKSASIWHNAGTPGADTHLIATIPMTQVFGMNFSFADPALFLPFEGPFGSVSPVNTNASYWDGDRVQATEFQNPFYFPAINSYRVEGFVLGMAINRVALSTGQFGQFPIFVFTTQGIWTMNIGNGDILIDKIAPLSGTICINGRSILGIDGGVIFMSNEGLMILAGPNPIGISDQVIGPPISPLAGLLKYENCINNANTYQPKAYMDGLTFEEYALDANIAFVNINLANAIDKEIIISNPAYNYSYVYSLISKAWHRISQTWDTFIFDLPKTLGTKYENATFNMDDLTLEQTGQSVMVHMETRPIRFGEELSYKKLISTMVYGWINSAVERPFTIYLFGSTDGHNWFIQNASNITNPGDKAALGRSSFSCRSYIIVMGGHVLDNTYITGLICDIEKRYNDKIR